jgi:hypothetical protein
MKRVLCLVFCLACSRVDAEADDATKPLRPSVGPVWAVARQVGMQPPTPNCTCASPESSPARTPWEHECDEPRAVCGDVHYREFIDRTKPERGRDRLGTLLTTHFVESMIYDATIMFAAPPSASYADHDAQMRVHRGDVIPTPHGRARVVQIYRSFVEHDDDGRVRLRFLDPLATYKPWLLHVSSGAPSHLDGEALELVRAASGEADIVTETAAALHLKKDDVFKTKRGAYKVVEVVDGRIEGALGWVTLDTLRP